ncbi:MAG: glycosyltransferase family 1 protein [Lachnospiraceae bacterium]|nr:glycosyltransferase family 1 protein [Lachnospiraceae bacterium]
MKTEKTSRILQVGMSPYYGGTESFLMNLYRKIDRTKIQFDFLNVYNKVIACQDEIESLGGKIYYLDMARHHGLKAYHKKLDNFFLENANKFDAVHCNFQSLINTDILKYAKKYGIKVRIAHAHNSGYGKMPNIKQKLIIAFNKMSLGVHATHYFACSELAANWMFGKKATIVKNAIDTERFLFSEEKRMSIRTQMGISDAFIVAFVGRMDPQKNPLFMLEIFSHLKAILPNAKLLVIGDGILKGQMVERISQLKIQDDVIMMGSRDDVNTLLQAADAFLLPSLFEGLGIVLIEAQAAGLPTITSDRVVPPYLRVTELLRFISLDDAPQEWARCIVKSKNTMRVNTKKEIENAGYDSTSNAKMMEDLYMRIMGENV